MINFAGTVGVISACLPSCRTMQVAQLRIKGGEPAVETAGTKKIIDEFFF